VTHVYTVGPNNWTISASATDDVNTYSASNTVAVTVNHVPPTLSISGAVSVSEGAPYTLNLSGSDTHPISNWTITWGDGSPAQTVNGNPPSVTHIYATGPNNWTISATATDNVGTYAAANTVSVTVNHVAPTLSISGPGSVNEGATYTLSLLGSDTHPITKWTITWGDGSPAQTVSGNPPSVTHVYMVSPNNYTISATATDNVGTYSAGNTVVVTVTPSSPAHIATTAGSGQSATVNTAFTNALQATVTDTFGNPVPGVAVTFAAPVSGASGTFAGSVRSVVVTINASGLATAPTFTANAVVGGYTVTATAAGVTTPASFNLNNAPAPTHLVFGQQPTSTTAGALLSPAVTVRLLDASNNQSISNALVTITIASGPAGATLSGSTTVAAFQGLATFTNLALTRAGTYTLLASSAGLTGVTSTRFTITAAGASSFSVIGFPSSMTAGTSHSTFTVTALDPYGNTATGYSGTVYFTSTDPQAVLPANYTFTAKDAGSQSFSATLETAGIQSLTAADTGNALVTGSETNIAVSPGEASKFLVAFSLPPGIANVTAGMPFSLTVTVVDAYGNVVPTYTGTVKFSDSVGSALLPPNYTFTTGSGKDNGVHTWTGLVLNNTGLQTLNVTDAKQKSLIGSLIVDVM
jgi:hypothetical protein